MSRALIVSITGGIMFWLFAAMPAGAQEKTPPIPTYRCHRAVGPITVDGKLSEASWSKAEVMGPLQPWSGKGRAYARTFVRLLWDAKYLYLGWYCADSKIVSTYEKRDDPIYKEECIEFFVDPQGTGKQYYEINVSPRNVIFDALISFEEVGKFTGDAKWTTEGMLTAVREIRGKAAGELFGWKVEEAIPFTALSQLAKRAPKRGETWRVNCYRIEREPYLEYLAWSPTLTEKENYHVPARFGRLQFVD